MFGTSQEALKFIKDNGIDMVDLKVVGIAGQWLHITVPARQFTQQHFEDGVGYDGSSGAGYGKVESGDVVARPEPESGFAQGRHEGVDARRPAGDREAGGGIHAFPGNR